MTKPNFTRHRLDSITSNLKKNIDSTFIFFIEKKIKALLSHLESDKNYNGVKSIKLFQRKEKTKKRFI